MLRYMLDTNICNYIIKNRPPEIRDGFSEHAMRVDGLRVENWVDG